MIFYNNNRYCFSDKKNFEDIKEMGDKIIQIFYL